MLVLANPLESSFLSQIEKMKTKRTKSLVFEELQCMYSCHHLACNESNTVATTMKKIKMVSSLVLAKVTMTLWLSTRNLHVSLLCIYKYV